MRILPLSLLAASLVAHAAFAVEVLDSPDGIGLANEKLSFLLRKDDGRLREYRTLPGGPNLVAAQPVTPLWTVEVRSGTAKPRVVPPGQSEKLSFVTRGDETQRTLEMTGEAEGRKVTVRASLATGSETVRWSMTVDLPRGEDRLWSITFPQIPVAALDPVATQNEMVVPYRRGQLRGFGAGFPRGDADLPYPGASAKFQFLAAYGQSSHGGLYFAAEDGQGYSKSFITRNYPQANSVVFAVQHFPANRGARIYSYTLPYDIVAGPFTGDWWDAARRYRRWWVQQEWASQGLLAERHDVPGWLLQASLALRPSTTKAARTVANNATAMHALSDALPGRPMFGVWYGGLETPGGGGLDEGHGHLLPPKPGLLDAVRDAKKRGIYLEQYIQSIIYDSGIPVPDAATAKKAVIRDESGQPVPYGGGLGAHLLSMCRASAWWQDREIELSRRAVAEWGFSGVYLDSFGKGAPECFAADHGHPIGGGNTTVAGQRVMARRIREAIRAVNPEAIMSGEDPIEAFRDVLDVNLYATNIMSRYVPIYRTVWGDYSLGHGRVLTPGPALIPELATLFLEGTIPGRLYCDTPNVFLLKPEAAADLAFFKSITAYTGRGLEYLRLGEYLHPLDLASVPLMPTVDFQESVERQAVRLPVVLHSVTRSHRDGTVAIVLVNIGADAQTVSVPIDPALRGVSAGPVTLLRLHEAGERTKIAAGQQPWKQSLTLAPREIAFFILE